jgi:hypothetical protein
MNTIKLTLLAVFLLASLAALHAADTPISHRVLCTDYKGNRVVIVSASGDIEWEFPAKTPQDCWLLPNGNVLFSQITGAAEVTMDKKVVWEYKAPAKALVHSCQPLPDGHVLVAECVTGRIVVVGRDRGGVHRNRSAMCIPITTVDGTMTSSQTPATAHSIWRW